MYISSAYTNTHQQIRITPTWYLHYHSTPHCTLPTPSAKKIARHMLPFNYAVGTPNVTNLIINTMQLQVEKYISHPQSTGATPSCAAVFFGLINQLNSVSRKAWCTPMWVKNSYIGTQNKSFLGDQ
jgi:hypothetical protein